MSQRFTAVLCTFLFVGLAVAVAPATTYNLTALTPLPSNSYEYANGVNNVNGAVEAVGNCWVSGSTTWTPCSWNSSGVATNLLSYLPGAVAGAANTDTANFIDANGDIAGQVCVGSSSAATSAFYIPGGSGTGTILPTLGGSGASAAAACSPSGLVVGYSVAADGNDHAFVWSQSAGIVDLGASGIASYAAGINSNGTVIVGSTGQGGPAGQGQACEWTKSGSTWTMTAIVPYTQFAQSTALCINNSGNAAGSCYNYPGGGFPSTSQDAIYIPNGASTAVNLGNENPSAPMCYARGINDSNVIVGSDGTGANRAWVDYNGTAAGMTLLSTLLAPGQGTGWTVLGWASAIDDNGDIAIRQGQHSGEQACILTPTPEPSTLLLAVGGLAGLLAYAWRKRK